MVMNKIEPDLMCVRMYGVLYRLIYIIWRRRNFGPETIPDRRA